MGAALISYAVEIASTTQKKGAVGIVSILTVIVKNVQQFLAPASSGFRFQFEHCAVVKLAALIGRSIEIASSIPYESAKRCKPRTRSWPS
jgi:hypothetical protein